MWAGVLSLFPCMSAVPFRLRSGRLHAVLFVRGQDIRGEVREGIGHPYQRGTRHVEDNLRESFGLKVRRLGRAAAQDSAELSRHQQRCYLGVQVLILYVDAGAVPGVNSLPVRH